MTKGFEIPVRSVPVTFGEGHALHGLEIEFRVNVSTNFYLDVLAWASIIDDDERDPESIMRDTRDAMVKFGDETLIGWNLTRNGEAVPATGDAFASSVDPFTGATIMARWASLVGRVPDPLAEPSEPSDTSETPKRRRRRQS